jgi:hypothetical protein
VPITVGTRLGPYEVVATLGSGGMGEAWKARGDREIMLLHLFKRLRPVLVLFILLASPSASGQSGRSWTKGIVFGPSETDGLQGAKVEK